MKAKFLALIVISGLVLGSSCTSSHNSDLNIREQPGIEYCGPWCAHMEELAKTDPNPELCSIYLETIVLENDAGTMNCVQFCQYEMKNSIQLNPQCMVTVTACSQVECASLLNENECKQLTNVCK